MSSAAARPAASSDSTSSSTASILPPASTPAVFRASAALPSASSLPVGATCSPRPPTSIDMVAIGTSFAGGGEGYLERVLPLVDVVEITPDSLAVVRDGRGHLRGEVLEVLEEIARRARLIVHGVGLSIGSHDG